MGAAGSSKEPADESSWKHAEPAGWTAGASERERMAWTDAWLDTSVLHPGLDGSWLDLRGSGLGLRARALGDGPAAGGFLDPRADHGAARLSPGRDHAHLAVRAGPHGLHHVPLPRVGEPGPLQDLAPHRHRDPVDGDPGHHPGDHRGAVVPASLLCRQGAEADMTLKVTGHQWFWNYEYPDNGGPAFDSHVIQAADPKPRQKRLLHGDNPLGLPVDTPRPLLLRRTDAMHSWVLPPFGAQACPPPRR